MKVMTVLGTRPEIIRLSRVIPKLDAVCDHVLVHTGQNFDPSLSDVFFRDLGVRAPDRSLGVRADSFGGQAGQYVLDEYRRGAVGNMPACPTTDLLQSVWDRLEAGDELGARSLFNRILPLINYERLHGIALYKAMLHRRGVIASQAMRNPGQELDEQDRVELAAILVDIEPLFQV